MTDFDPTPASSGDLPAFDFTGALDTSSVTAADVVAAVVIMIATVIIATIVGHLTRKRLSRPETNSLQVARFAGTGARWAVIFTGGALALSFLGADVAWLTITIVLIIVISVLIAKPLLEKYAAGIALATATGFGIGDEIIVKGY